MIWVWVNTYRYNFSGMNIHLPAILGSLGTRVLTHPHFSRNLPAVQHCQGCGRKGVAGAHRGGA